MPWGPVFPEPKISPLLSRTALALLLCRFEVGEIRYSDVSIMRITKIRVVVMLRSLS